MACRSLINRMLAAVSLLCGVQGAYAETLDQYANTVIGYSSQWSSGSWSVSKALGAPDTFSYGDISTAWAPGPKNGSEEFLTLGFSTPVYSSGAVIRETYGNGFVYQVDALDGQNNLHQVWKGTDSSQPGSAVDFFVSWATTNFQTKGLKIYVDTNHNLSAWEEIDSVKLIGQTAPVPEPETYAMLLAGLGLMAGVARRKSSLR